MDMRASLGADPLGVDSPRPAEAGGGAPAAGGGGSATTRTFVTPLAAQQDDPDEGTWGAMNPVAESSEEASRSRTSPLSLSTGALPVPNLELAETGVSPTSGDSGGFTGRPVGGNVAQSPDFHAPLDRLARVQRQRSGADFALAASRHLRTPGNFLRDDLFEREGSDLSPRARNAGTGLLWRGEAGLTATEALARYEQRGPGPTTSVPEHSPLQRWSSAAALALGVGESESAAGQGRERTETGGTVATGVPPGGGAVKGQIGENCLVIMTIVTLGVVLFLLQPVLVPLVLAVFVSAMLLPMLDFVTERPFHIFGRTWLKDSCGLCLKVEKRYNNWLGRLVSSLLTLRLPNVLGLIVVIGLCCSLIFGLSLIVYYSVEAFLRRSDYYEDRVANLSASLPSWIIDQIHGGAQGAVSKDRLFGTLTSSTALGEVAMDILLESEHIVATTALTFLYTIFILLGRQDRSMRETKRTMTVIEDQLKVYISWKFIVSAVSGFIIGVTLSHLGIDLAAVFGLLTFFLNFIPTVGLLVAVLLPLPLIYLAPPEVTTTHRVLAFLIPYGLQVVVTNVVEPLVFGRRLHLHPIFVLFSLVFWNMLWGITGAVLSIPIMCVLKIVLLNMPNPTATFIASVMEGQFEASRARWVAMSKQSQPEYRTSPPPNEERVHRPRGDVESAEPEPQAAAPGPSDAHGSGSSGDGDVEHGERRPGRRRSSRSRER